MNYEFIEDDQYALIKLSGDLVAQYQSNELLKKVKASVEDNRPNFVIDFGDMNYINSSGLSMLLHILNSSRKAEGETILVNIPDHLMKLLVITKLHSIFIVATNIDEAIVHFEKRVDTEIS